MIDRREAVVAAIRGRLPDEPVTLPAGWIQALLVTEGPSVEVDLSGAQVAELLGRNRVTIATWCRSGLFERAYKLRGREWRIPAASFATFQMVEGDRLVGREDDR